MKIIKNNIDELLVKVDYIYKEEYADKLANTLFNYWCFFEKKEYELRELLGEPLENVLYSKYYWCEQYKKDLMNCMVKMQE